MFGALLGGLIDQEKVIKERIESAIENVSEELECDPRSIFIMIKPIKSDSPDFVVYLYKTEVGVSPKMVREMKLKEFVE